MFLCVRGTPCVDVLAWYYKGLCCMQLHVHHHHQYTTITHTTIITQEELFRLLENESLSKTPVLILANKQDLRQAMSVAELSEALALHSIKKHDWHIQGCCALSGQGLLDGVSWIAQRVDPSSVKNNGGAGGSNNAGQQKPTPSPPPKQPISTSAAVVSATTSPVEVPGTRAVT